MVKTGQDCRYAVGHIRGYYVEDGPDPARGRIGHRTGAMQDPASELPRTPLLGTWVNRPEEERRHPLYTWGGRLMEGGLRLARRRADERVPTRRASQHARAPGRGASAGPQPGLPSAG